MIAVVFYEDKEDGKYYVSHGIDIETSKITILPQEEKNEFIKKIVIMM